MINNVEQYINKINEAVSYIKEQIGNNCIPSVCIVLGSGLGPLADSCDVDVVIPYKDIPGFPVSTVAGHDGKLIVGTLEGKKVFLMSGRFHYYEGYDTSLCTFYVRVMCKLGVNTMYFTNAAGGIADGMKPAELMIITDHLSFYCESPLRGPNLDDFGPRFPDQTNIYDPDLITKLETIASEAGIKIHKGIYAYSRGPQYETPAEIQALKGLGASAVGMSTVPEAIIASHSGMRVAAVSCISNLAAGISKTKLCHEEVMTNASKASNDSCTLAKLFIKSL